MLGSQYLDVEANGGARWEGFGDGCTRNNFKSAEDPNTTLFLEVACFTRSLTGALPKF